MALQRRMLFLPTDAELISAHLAAARHDGRLTFFDASGPIFSCREADDGALRFAAAMLTEPALGRAGPSQMARAVGRHRSRVHEYRTRYRAGGAAALEVKRRGPAARASSKAASWYAPREGLAEGAVQPHGCRAGGGVRADDPQGAQGRPLGAPAGRRADGADDGGALSGEHTTRAQ